MSEVKVAEALADAPVDEAGRAAEPAEDVVEEVVAPRLLVPSEREVDEGLADYTFEPLPRPDAATGVPVSARLKHVLDDLRPSRLLVAGGGLPFTLLALSAFFNYWDDAAFGVLIPEIRDEFDVDVRFLVGLSAVLSLVAALVAPVFGWIADRRNRVRMLAIGNIVQNASSIAAGQAPNVAAIAGARLTAGIGQGIANPTAVPLITDWFPFEMRARIINSTQALGTLGWLTGPVVAGTLGTIFGWRTTITVLGIMATAISAGFLLLKEPTRGRLDRLAMGADEATASREQKPVTWSEGWRAASQIGTLRRIWYATPFILSGFQIFSSLAAFYWADQFGVSPFGRGVIAAVGTAGGVVALTLLGPIVDRLIKEKPGRVFTFLGGFMLMSVAALALFAVSPVLWLSIVLSIPMMVGTVLILPVEIILVSTVVPARLRALGVATIAPWQVLGQVMVLVLLAAFGFDDVIEAMWILIPVNLVAALLIVTAGGVVERDIRAALAASMADEEARRAKERGRGKMVICRDVDVTYDGTQVLFGVDFDVEEGELVALLGTNGAGKSTLLRAITGIQEASSGAIFLDGEDITHRPPHQNAAGGIVFMPGGRAVFPSLTVAENLRAAAWMYREDEEYVRTQTEKVLDYFPVLRSRLDQTAGSMSGGEQQMVALGQAFLMKPRLLMIDELSLGLAPAVVEQLLGIVRQVNADGATVVLVEQSVNVALTIARRAVFMDKGEVRFDGPTAELLSRGDLLRSVFLGGAGGGQRGSGGPFIASGTGLRKTAKERVAPELVLRVEGVHVSYGGHKALADAGVHVMTGEVVGIIGPNGAGKTTLFDVISGYTPPDAGVIEIGGVDATTLGPDARARLGLSRSFQNARLFPALTVRENVALALEQRLATRSILSAALWLPKHRNSERRAFRRVEYLIELLNLGPFADKFVTELSTGSRRMVDMACVMASEPKALLLDEPSSGLAQSEVEMLAPVVRRLARETGCGVLVIEHDIPLITVLSDRLVAMELGSVLAEGAPRDVVDDPRVVQAYLGASESTINRSGSFAAALVAAGLSVSDDVKRKSSP